MKSVLIGNNNNSVNVMFNRRQQLVEKKKKRKEKKSQIGNLDKEKEQGSDKEKRKEIEG